MNADRRCGFIRPRLSTTLFALSIVIVAVVSGLAVTGTPVGPRAGQPVIFDEEMPPSLPSRAHPAVLFVGDSYMEGPGTSDLSFGCLAATELGWDCNVAAQGATGYINGGPGNRHSYGEYSRPSTAFVERLPRMRELYRADIVVLDGGRNDLQFNMTDVLREFAYTLTQVIEAWPNSRVVVIVPWFLTEPVIRLDAFAGHTVGERFLAVLRSSPRFNKVELIDPAALGWFAGMDIAPYLSEDGIHPNLEGHKFISHLLVKALVDGEAVGLS
ncbi:SGNH/GDSL hydrolase family protein [soil metagenome]